MAAKIIRLTGVMGAIGVSKSTVYQWIHEGKFPAPVRLGSRSVGWRQADVDAWIASREEVQRANCVAA